MSDYPLDPKHRYDCVRCDWHACALDDSGLVWFKGAVAEHERSHFMEPNDEGEKARGAQATETRRAWR